MLFDNRRGSYSDSTGGNKKVYAGILILIIVISVIVFFYKFVPSINGSNSTCTHQIMATVNNNQPILKIGDEEQLEKQVRALQNQQNKTFQLVKSLRTESIKSGQGQGQGPIQSKKQTIYTLILVKTKKALDRLGIPFFLSSGTCLGYFREGKFIDWDYDIDVGIYAKDYDDKIVAEMKKEGLILYRVLGNLKEGMELSFRLPKTVLGKYAKIDIFLHYPTEDNKKIYWISYMAPQFKKRIKYQVTNFGIKEVNFMGLSVNVPDPTIRYIEDHYGKDWMIPKKPFTEYVYSRSPVSIVKE